MKILGLTGPSGAGKGLASAIFLQHGIPAVDTDAVYHAILSRGDDCTAELVGTFGKKILDGSGLVNRKKLGAAVFGKPNTPELLHTLNTITHKYIMAETRDLLRTFENNGARAAIIDAPQLFEAGADRECHLVVGVLAERAIRIRRIMTRDRISEEAAIRRINAQKDDDFYRTHCDYILENSCDDGSLAEQIRNFLIKFDLGLS